MLLQERVEDLQPLPKLVCTVGDTRATADQAVDNGDKALLELSWSLCHLLLAKPGATNV